MNLAYGLLHLNYYFRKTLTKKLQLIITTILLTTDCNFMIKVHDKLGHRYS